MVRQVAVGDLQERVDAQAKERRELENALQEHNCTTPLLE
jgi:hypothetical protein